MKHRTRMPPNSALYAIILACSITTAICTYLIYRNNQIEKEAEKRNKAMTGNISPEHVSSTAGPMPNTATNEPPPTNQQFMQGPDADKYKVSFGGLTSLWLKEQLGNPMPINQLISVDGQIPIVVYMKGGRLMVSAKFFNYKNEIIAELKENDWAANASTVYKRNYDANAVEVIDNHDVVVLKAYFESPMQIRIEGMIAMPRVILIGAGQRIYSVPNLSGSPGEQDKFAKAKGVSWENYVLEKARLVQPMFSYAGTDYLGQRLSSH